MNNAQTEAQRTEFSDLVERFTGASMIYFEMIARFRDDEIRASANLSQQMIDKVKIMVGGEHNDNQQALKL